MGDVQRVLQSSILAATQVHGVAVITEFGVEIVVTGRENDCSTHCHSITVIQQVNRIFKKPLFFLVK